MKKLTLLASLISILALTSCSNVKSVTGDVYEVSTSATDGITFFAIESNNQKIGFYLDEYYDNDTLILSQIKVEYDKNSKSTTSDSNMEDITTYIADNITVTKMYESSWS